MESSDPSEHPAEPVASYFTQPLAIVPTPLLLPAPDLQSAPLRKIPVVHVSPATSAPSAGSVTPFELRGPAPIPYHIHAGLVESRDFLLGQNRELLQILDPSEGSSHSPASPDQPARHSSD